jgi:hypothetical protein
MENRCMRRAIPLLVLTAALSALAVPAAAQPTVMNGIGLVDYTKKPTFKVGDWARYQMTSQSELGASDNYQLTVVVSGEEDFWGDPGFWVETWVVAPGYPPTMRASLVSYEIFSDTSATEKLLLYVRKMINQLNEDGSPRIEINKPAGSTLKVRHEVKNPVRYTRVPLGPDTVHTPKGLFETRKVLLQQGKGVTQDVGDSTTYTELREDRTSWYTDVIPITHLAREDLTTTFARKAWLAGRSGDALQLNIKDRGTGTARLIDFGHGLEGRLVPKHLRRSLAEQKAAARPKAASTTASKRL